MSRFAHRHLSIMGDFAQVVVQPADHDDGEAPAGFDPLRSRARDSRAMPLGNRNHLRDREADGRGRRDALGNAVFEHVEARRGGRQLDRDVRRPGMEAFRHRGHAGAVAGAERIHLRADESRGAPACLEARLQLVGGAQDGNPDQRFGLRLARQIRSEGAADLGTPGLAIPGQRRAHEHGVRRHADGAAGQAEIELGCVSRVVPPLRRRLTDQPLEIGAHTFMSIVNFQPPRTPRARIDARYGEASPELVGCDRADERRRATPKASDSNKEGSSRRYFRWKRPSPRRS